MNEGGGGGGDGDRCMVHLSTSPAEINVCITWSSSHWYDVDLFDADENIWRSATTS